MISHISKAMPVYSRTTGPGEGLGFFRFLMVLSSLAPLFIFLAIRGVPVIDGKPIFSDSWYVAACCAIIAIPALIVAFRVFISGKRQDNYDLVVGTATDHRDHLIAYLFAVIIPFYQNNYTTVRDVIAAFTALCFILYLFYYMNLHYMNLVFALAGYRVFTVDPEAGSNPYSGRRSFILITKRHSVPNHQKITTRRITDTVFIEL